MPQPTVECVWELGATLGEGPMWNADDGAVWFVDIKRHQVHRFTPSTNERKSWHAPDQVAWVQPTVDGRWLAGLKTGLHWFDPESGSFTKWFDPEPQLPGNRLNDSCVDPHGRLWFGTMDDAEKEATGSVYRLTEDGTAVACGPECCIVNGPVASPDGKTLYHVDTLASRIWRYDIAASGELSNAEVLTEIEHTAGHPDGPTIDAEGCIWVGLFGGWGVRRYSPSGELLAEVKLPVANVTKIALGGPNLTTAFATTASMGLDEAQLAEQPLAGCLFSFEVDVPGLPAPKVSIGLPPR
ncbi:MAG: SMP-30/gluconolactonase/LRE family protein [Sphingomonas sp.]